LKEDIVQYCTAAIFAKPHNLRLEPLAANRRKTVSKRNGDRSRFNRVRKLKMHDRTRIRLLRQSLAPQAEVAAKKPEPAVA